MKPETWRTIAIIFIILFTIETLFMLWAGSEAIKDSDNEVSCYYETCGDYIDAYYEWNTNLCSCLNYDENGEAFVTYQEVIK